MKSWSGLTNENMLKVHCMSMMIKDLTTENGDDKKYSAIKDSISDIEEAGIPEVKNIIQNIINLYDTDIKENGLHHANDRVLKCLVYSIKLLSPFETDEEVLSFCLGYEMGKEFHKTVTKKILDELLDGLI